MSNYDFTCLLRWRFLRSCYIISKTVAILGCRCFNKCWLLRSGHVRKFPFFISFRKVLGVGLKQHPWRYWINYVFFLSLVMIAWAQCFNGIDIHMYHKPSVLFLCPFKTRVLFFRILISFLSNMDTQSLSHSWPEDISKAQCNPPKNCALFAWMLRLLDSGMLPVFVTFIVALFGNWTVGPYLVSLMLANNDIYSVYQ